MSGYILLYLMTNLLFPSTLSNTEIPPFLVFQFLVFQNDLGASFVSFLFALYDVE